MSALSFREFFAAACGDGRTPYPYQERLACEESFPELLDVPTGLGKTAAAVLAWVWRRRFHSLKNVRRANPRRLAYCLPMRVLVEQTYSETRKWLANLGLLADSSHRDENDPRSGGWAAEHGDDGYRIAVHLLMGGEDATDWALWPERDAILIGTQDMLLSRALNRGYAASRARWPMEFGLLNNDCLWVFDEIQCMGSGLLTTAQLAAFARRLWPQQPPCSFLWMSATLGEGFLNTRDREDWKVEVGRKLQLSIDDLEHSRVQQRLRAEKRVQIIRECPKAVRILDDHIAGRLSLVVLNTVPAAKSLYAELLEEAGKQSRKKKRPAPEIGLIHARFRPKDRKRQMKAIEAFLANFDGKTGAVPDNPGLVLVATQVVEAGLDISSVRLWSELAPWASAIQRLGRLNRDGVQPDATGTFWAPKDDKSGENSKDSPNAKRIGPYDKPALDTSRKLLELVIDLQGRGSAYRGALDEAIQTSEGQQSLQVEADVVIRPDDFHGLFSTESDLAGGFTNISHFVRASDRNMDVRIFWRDFPLNRAPDPQGSKPSHDELCSTPYYDLRRFLGAKGCAWEWDHEASSWARRRAVDVQPGMTLLLPVAAGGYSDSLGWTGISRDKPSLEPPDNTSEDGLNRDQESATEQWATIAGHTSDVEAELQKILKSLDLPASPLGQSLLVAARWHDWGKSLNRWQDAVCKYATEIREKLAQTQADSNSPQFHSIAAKWSEYMQPPAPPPTLWAKFPDIRNAWRECSLPKEEIIELRRRLRTQFDPGLRHEAASALAAWDEWQKGADGLSALAVYLIASHHGKVRTVLRSANDADEIFGLRSADYLRPVDGYFNDGAPLQFDCKRFGANGQWDALNTQFLLESPSWAQVNLELLGPVEPGERIAAEAVPDTEPRNLGPFVLAYLEAVFRAADVRASRSPGKGAKR